MKKVGIYVRVSTEGSKNGHVQDTGMQILDIQRYLESKGIKDFEIYEDKGFTGMVKNRPALKKLIQDCRHGKISTVVCWKLDRFFRSLKDLMNTLSEFEALNIEFVALKDGIDMSTATGRLMMQIVGAFAEFEAAVIKERVKSGLENAKSKGVKLGRPASNGHLVLNQLASKGMDTRQIASHTGLSMRTVRRGLAKSRTEN